MPGSGSGLFLWHLGCSTFLYFWSWHLSLTRPPIYSLGSSSSCHISRQKVPGVLLCSKHPLWFPTESGPAGSLGWLLFPLFEDVWAPGLLPSRRETSGRLSLYLRPFEYDRGQKEQWNFPDAAEWNEQELAQSCLLVQINMWDVWHDLIDLLPFWVWWRVELVCFYMSQKRTGKSFSKGRNVAEK